MQILTQAASQVASQEAALARHQSAGAADKRFQGALAWCEGMADLLASLSGVKLLEVGGDLLRMRLTTAAGACLMWGCRAVLAHAARL